MGNRRTIALIGLIIIAIAVAVGAFVWRSRSGGAEPSPEATPESAMVSIVVAINNLDRGKEIQPGMVEVVPWPEDRLPPYYQAGLYYNDPEQVYGMTLRTFVPQGMPLVRSMLSEGPVGLTETGSEISLSIPAGKRAVAIPLDMLGAVAWLIQPGDHVDVMASWTFVDLDEEFQTPLPNEWVILECPEGALCSGTMGRMELLPTGQTVLVYPTGPGMSRYVAQVTIQDAVVLRVGAAEQSAPTSVPGGEGQAPPPEEATPPPPASAAQPVVLVLDAQDALVLKALLELRADVDLVLRGADDQERVTTEQVTLEYITSQYGIDPPPKLPYGATTPLLNRLQNAMMESAVSELKGGGDQGSGE